MMQRAAHHMLTNVNKRWLRRTSVILFLDVLIILAAYLFALLLCFDFRYSTIPAAYLYAYAWAMPFWIISTIVVYYGCRLYHSIWSFASIHELERIAAACAILAPVYAAGTWFMKLQMPSAWYFMGYLLTFCVCTSIRFSYRLLRYWKQRRERQALADSGQAEERIMVIGAGEAGQVIIKELQRSGRLNSRVCCVIDDNPGKKGRYLEGVEIIGGRKRIPDAVKDYGITHIIFAIPSAKKRSKTAILNICQETGCKLQTLPGIYQLVKGEVSVSQLRDVDITDLLGRDEIEIDNNEVEKLIADQTVLVTGGGGSIGSELCRQIAQRHPKMLVLFDIYENNVYDLQQELKRVFPDLNLKVLIGSVRDEERIRSIMEIYRPKVVFHAAAHKHVPLMEDSPNEAVKNNALGTYKTAKAAGDYGVKKFILISTDKAVNPTNIMGATKRLCEMVIQMMNQEYPKTEFVAVRFGNVLGSNGSVIPLFKKQIAEGGPVTVTHPDIIRYFMTIPEAVSLVLQATTYAEGGEIFVLDMGEPVKIADMAKNLIRLSGYTPDVDIKIEYTGLRPGEKLYEELLMAEEGLRETPNKLIFIGQNIDVDDSWLAKKLVELEDLDDFDSETAKKLVHEIVPTYVLK